MTTTTTRRDLLKWSGLAMGAALIPNALRPSAAFAEATAQRKRSIRLAHLTDMHIQPEKAAGEGVAACLQHVQGLADKINALETTLKQQTGVLAAAKVAEMTENLDNMKREYKRKAEDLEADAGRERDKAFAPISGKLGKFAEDYTAKRGIVMLVDIANALQSGTVIWFDPRSDITQDFINEYNKANPVATAAAKPAIKN